MNEFITTLNARKEELLATLIEHIKFLLLRYLLLF